MIPKLVVPDVATTTNTRFDVVACSASMAAATALPINFPLAATGTFIISTSITFAALTIEEWASSLQAITHLVASGDFFFASERATTNAERFPMVPPCTNTPPAASGIPAKSDSQRSAWFSAKTAPAPSCHEPPYKALAPTTRSKRFAYSLGAEGIKAKFRG